MFEYTLLRGLMATRNISISSLAAEIGISRASLSQKFKGQRPFTESEMLAVMSSLNISTADADKFFFNLRQQK